MYINIVTITALNLYISSSSFFFLQSLGFDIYDIILSANSDGFTSFTVWIPFISFSFLAWLLLLSHSVVSDSV